MRPWWRLFILEASARATSGSGIEWSAQEMERKHAINVGLESK
jgi:hypothetical protein